jgi:hypothetical protein
MREIEHDRSCIGCIECAHEIRIQGDEFRYMRDQLAAARAEVERLKAITKDCVIDHDELDQLRAENARLKKRGGK